MSLNRLENVANFTEFVKAFSNFGVEMIELAQLTNERQNVGYVFDFLFHFFLFCFGIFPFFCLFFFFQMFWAFFHEILEFFLFFQFSFHFVSGNHAHKIK